MKVQILREDGYDIALFGLGFSRGITSEMEFSEFVVKGEGWASPEFEQMCNLAQRLSQKDGGHNKFLEHIAVWLDVDMPREFWQEFAEYRIGRSNQSESTMYTLLKRLLTQLDFEGFIHPDILNMVNEQITAKNHKRAKRWLPEGFLQRREIVTNYKTLRNIYKQRRGHKLEEWQVFCNTLKIGLQHPEFLK